MVAPIDFLNLHTFFDALTLMYRVTTRLAAENRTDDDGLQRAVERYAAVFQVEYLSNAEPGPFAALTVEQAAKRAGLTPDQVEWLEEGRVYRFPSVDHAIELLGSGRDAKLLAGGHSLLPLMRLRLARPDLLVDVGRLGDVNQGFVDLQARYGHYSYEGIVGAALAPDAPDSELRHKPIVLLARNPCDITAQVLSDPASFHTCAGSLRLSATARSKNPSGSGA